MKKVKIESSGRMSNRQYHANGKPNWWARVGSNDSVKWLEVGRVRGDDYLAVEVEVPDTTTEIHIGCGPKGHGKRETISV